MLDMTKAYGLDFIFPAGDEAIGASLALYGEFARPVTDFLIGHASKTEARTLIDAGANIGSIGLPFAKYRPSWRVIAIEAHRGIASILSANALNNDLENVSVIQAAAGATRCIVEFPDTDYSGGGNWGILSLKTETDRKAPVLMLPLDEIAPANTGLVKIDVEGHDAEVLRGASRLLRQTRPIWFVEAATNHPAEARQVIEILLSAGYAVHWFWSPFVTMAASKGRTPTDFKGDANVVALPPGVANDWNLPAVRSADDQRPSDAASYPYLERYGIR